VKPAAPCAKLKSRRPTADLFLDMFEWKDAYSVHINSVDSQHKNLFRLADELYDAMLAGKGKAAVGAVLQRLLDYTRVHFAHEERLMQECGYPDYAAHKAEHDALTREVQRLQAEYTAGRITMTVQVMQFLKNWLEKHIANSDLKYAPHVAASAGTR
jgi:hemerythrin